MKKSPTTRINNQHRDKQIWFCVRHDGLAKRSGWKTNARLADVPHLVQARQGDVVELNDLRAAEIVLPSDFHKKFQNLQRGVLGVEFYLHDKCSRFAPSYMIASNLSFARALERFIEESRATSEEFAQHGNIRVLTGDQFLVEIGRDSTTELTRGSTVVSETPEINENRSEDIARGIEHWLLNNLSNKSELPYKYWPSRGQESPADNAIRRFLGSLALARLAEYRNSARLREAARDNLRYNLTRYFQSIGGGLGAIVESTGAKLGSAAIAGLAILENFYHHEFTDELNMLAKGIRSLADRNNKFSTFFFPEERQGQNWNFYSGEALLFWAEAIRRNLPFAPSLTQCVATFRQCRRRHRRNRNPAFVPWHSQVCTLLYSITGKREFVNFLFEMNDWLLPMQQWEEVPVDMRGRFFSPNHRRDWGPPHAASTGVYCEGLADATSVAKQVGDSSRAKIYQRALERGLRSLRQLQFRDATDAFYISQKDRVMGALRTEVYDNSVRIDSVAHALIAVLKVLQPTTLSR